MFWRLLTGCCTKGFSDSILLMNDHFTKETPTNSLQPDVSLISTESYVKPHILEPVDNIKLSRSQYIVTSITNYGPYIVTCLHSLTFCLSTLQTNFYRYNLKITSPSPSLAHDPLIPRYDKILHYKYGEIVLVIKQIIKQHYSFDHAWNHINKHSNIANETSRHKRGLFLTIFNFLFGPLENQTVKQLEKNVAILMENQNLQQSVLEAHAKALNITTMHLANNHAYQMTQILTCGPFLNSLKYNPLTYSKTLIISLKVPLVHRTVHLQLYYDCNISLSLS